MFKKNHPNTNPHVPNAHAQLPCVYIDIYLSKKIHVMLLSIYTLAAQKTYFAKLTHVRSLLLAIMKYAHLQEMSLRQQQRYLCDLSYCILLLLATLKEAENATKKQQRYVRSLFKYVHVPKKPPRSSRGIFATHQTAPAGHIQIRPCARNVAQTAARTRLLLTGNILRISFLLPPSP